MKGIRIPIFKHNDDTRRSKDLGIDYSYDECEEEEIIFYRIEAISEEVEGDKSYTEIHCNGTCFVSPLQINEVEELLKDL
jgi:hypothetical protein